MKEKLYKCKFCGERKPLSEIQVRMPYVCRACIPLYFEENKEKVLKKAASDVRKKERQRLNKKKEELMTLSDWKQRLQNDYFNKYINLRDKGLPCIACGKPIKGAPHASHYFSVGAYDELRFDEMNVHSGCNSCNTYRGGNLAEYAINLPKKIGVEQFEALRARRNIPKHYTIPDIKELIEVYKKKIRDLKNSR